MVQVVVTHRWKIAAVVARAKGFSERDCAAIASVGLGQLQRELNKDAKFKSEFESAFENAPPPPRW